MPARPRQIRHGQDARKKILNGALTLARTVATTYGPGGRTVLIQRFAGLLATKDGLTVAQEVTLPDREENLGAQILKEACIQVNKEVGDGTTSTAILAGKLLREGHKMVVGGYHPQALVTGIRAAAETAIEAVRGFSRPVTTQEELRQVALIACNGDEEIAQHLSEAVMAVGKDGTISIVDGIHTETVLEFKEGMEIPSGTDRVFRVTDKGDTEKVFEGALVAIVQAPLVSVDDVLSMLEESTQWPDNPLIIIAPRIERAARETLLLNSSLRADSRRVKEVCPILAPGMPQQKRNLMGDIATLTQATVVDPVAGMDHRAWNPEWFGTLRRATVRAESSLFEAYPEVHEAVEMLLSLLRSEEKTLPDGFLRDQLRERMGKLSGGIAILRVGGVTEVARKERRARIEDALGAVRTALRGGIVPGAGTAYHLAALHLRLTPINALPGDPGNGTGYMTGWHILGTALMDLVPVLVRNCGGNGEGYTHQLTLDLLDDIIEHEDSENPPTPWLGWDPDSESTRNLQEPLVADPTEVVVSVIRAAVSVATTLLTAETSVTFKG